jgi:hypothetical protein
MKNLILGDCDHLIKFILFGDNDDEINNLHIPRKTFWKKRNITNDDGTEEYHEITNIMELAIYHCKGKF